MKRYLIYMLLLISSAYYGQIYSVNHRMYGTMNTPSYDNYKNINGGSNIRYSNPNIGYSTSSFGRINTYNMYERQYENVYSGTYNPGNNSRPGQLRKVHGYTSEGEYVGDDNGKESDFWESSYEYYWDGEHWWRRRKSGGGLFKLEWQMYTNDLWNWHWSIFEEIWKSHPNTSTTPQSYQNNPRPHPDDPYADPIGEFPIGLLLILSFLFVYYKKFKNKTN